MLLFSRTQEIIVHFPPAEQWRFEEKMDLGSGMAWRRAGA